MVTLLVAWCLTNLGESFSKVLQLLRRDLRGGGHFENLNQQWNLKLNTEQTHTKTAALN